MSAVQPAFIVRYPGEDDGGRHVGVFSSYEAAASYARRNPACDDEWQPYVIELEAPQ